MSYSGMTAQRQPQGFFGSMPSPASFTSPPMNPQALSALASLQSSQPTPVTPVAMAPSLGTANPSGQPNLAQIQAALQRLQQTNPQQFLALMQAIRQRQQQAMPPNPVMSAAG